MTDEKIKEELKPCPLCGGEAKQIAYNRVACKKCGLRTVQNQSFLANKRLWNTRSAERLAKIEVLELAKQMFFDLDEMNPVDYTDSFDVINTLLDELKAGK